MPDSIDDLTRLALFEAWDEKCVWCWLPLFFNDMEVEHLLPKSRDGKDNKKLFEQHGLAPDFDLNALENLAPSCGPCNRGKGKRPPPEAPGVADVLQRARDRAPTVRTDAEKFKSDRRLMRALAVVSAAAEGGDAKALEELTRAAEQVSTTVRDLTGQEVRRLHTALPYLAEAGSLLFTGDPYFAYPGATHETEGPAPGPTPGAVMSIEESGDGVTTRIDVVPRGPDSMERFGPEFVLTPADGDAGQQAAIRLQEALSKGEDADIEGIDFTFKRLPPGLEDLVGRRMTGGRIKLSVGERVAGRPVMPDWDAQLTIRNETGDTSVPVVLRQLDEVPDGWDDGASGQFGGMTATMLLRSDGRRGEITFNFAHRRDSSPVSEQLAALRLLEASSHGGCLIITDSGATERPTVEIPANPAEWSPASAALLAFLSDLNVIEDWAGVTFQLPDDVTAAQAHVVASVAKLVREGERTATWSSAKITVREPGLAQVRAGGVMRIVHDASAEVLGEVVELGTLQQELPAFVVVSEEPAADQPGYVDVRIEPPDDDAAKIIERLVKVAAP